MGIFFLCVRLLTCADIFSAGIDVALPAPPPVTTTTPAPPALVITKAGGKEASPSPTTSTARYVLSPSLTSLLHRVCRNLCLAVWCAESGGPVASFTVYWDGIKKDKKLLQICISSQSDSFVDPPCLQAYENCAKNLVRISRPILCDIILIITAEKKSSQDNPRSQRYSRSGWPCSPWSGCRNLWVFPRTRGGYGVGLGLRAGALGLRAKNIIPTIT